MFEYWGEAAALATAVCWSLTAIFFSFGGRIVGSEVVNRTRVLLALILLSLTHWLVEGSLFPTEVESFRWGWLTISSILGLVLGDSFLFQAYVMIGPRLSMLLMATVPIYSTMFAWVLFGETVTGVEMGGILLTVFGVAWVVSEKRQTGTVVENKQYKKGLLFGLAGALGQVTNLVTARYGLVDGFSTISATWIRILVAVIILWIIAGLRGEAVSTVRQWRNRQAFAAVAAGSVVGPFLGIWFSLIAVQLARLGIASTLMALPPVLLIPTEYFVFRRPVSTRGVVGTLAAFAGVAMIFVLN